MTERKWLDHGQPQTLQSAVLLSYVSAAVNLGSQVLFSLPSAFIVSVLLSLAVAGLAYFVANEKRPGYYGAIVATGALLVAQLALVFTGYPTVVISALFTVAMGALYLHPQSREYQRIWFR